VALRYTGHTLPEMRIIISPSDFKITPNITPYLGPFFGSADNQKKDGPP
jgi:hypothetical protein